MTSNKQNLEPASAVISALGGIKKTASITGKSTGWVHRWTYDAENGGTGGRIPEKSARVIWDYVCKEGLDVSFEDVFFLNTQKSGPLFRQAI